MTKGIRYAIAVVILGAAAALIYKGVHETSAEKGGIAISQAQKEAEKQLAIEEMKMVSLKGHVSLDMEPFLNDERVVKRLGEAKFKVAFTRLGSRDMASHLMKAPKVGSSDGVPAFYITSGVVAGNQVSDAAKELKLNPSSYSPLYTPLVYATWKPIGEILTANGIARIDKASQTYEVDNRKLLDVMLAKKRWSEMKDASKFSVNRSVLVSTTDLSKSNSAAMYLALMSFSLNGSNVVDSNGLAESSSERLTELFARQGYQENYVNGNFDDYTSVGMGKTPLAFIYENQLVAYAKKSGGKMNSEMVIAYPTPTIFNKQVFVATSEPAKKLGEFLSTDPTLQKIAVEYGFRAGSQKEFAEMAKKDGLAVKETVLDVIEPPAHTFMTLMIDTVAKQTRK